LRLHLFKTLTKGLLKGYFEALSWQLYDVVCYQILFAEKRRENLEKGSNNDFNFFEQSIDSQ